MNRVVLAVITNYQKEVLVAKVKASHLEKFNGLQYVFPGGMVEEDESDEEALVREILEETGWNIDVEAQISFWISPATNEEVYTYHCLTTDINKPIVISNNNTESLEWFNMDDLKTKYPEMNPDVLRYLEFIWAA